MKKKEKMADGSDPEALELRKAAANRWIIEHAPKRDFENSWEKGKNFVEWDVLLEFMALYKVSDNLIPAVSEGEINDLIQPHAITLEHGEKAARDIFELLQSLNK